MDPAVRKLVYLMPPYIIRPEQLSRLTDAIAAIAD
ncbi:adenosylmethionine--8-amino-7-oxononanoate transaminase [Serratia rubidaea]|uniref:Adenosylmethionine--8-amino-7-oxononanoate transaminase n=1 Tax=Serratia rubidaea TaxID=61652 RepID=A0A4U9HDN9_SERRU|nr:adenosylmethionine--8-amino-7-oxononanoate transaminase [Serratia rubidaea]